MKKLFETLLFEKAQCELEKDDGDQNPSQKKVVLPSLGDS